MLGDQNAINDSVLQMESCHVVAVFIVNGNVVLLVIYITVYCKFNFLSVTILVSFFFCLSETFSTRITGGRKKPPTSSVEEFN